MNSFGVYFCLLSCRHETLKSVFNAAFLYSPLFVRNYMQVIGHMNRNILKYHILVQSSVY